MLNTRLLLGMAMVAFVVLTACTNRTNLGQDAQGATACKPVAAQVDRGCNEDPSLPMMAGVCELDGSCTCYSGFVLNPTTKRCKLVTSGDSGVVICTVGADQTCNDDPSVSMIAGTCVGGVTCACKTGFLLNPATGRCQASSSADGGADSATGGLVCTFLVDQTCNDDDTFSGTAGVCMKGGTCTCNAGFVINPATGRCRDGSTVDAATTARVCTPGIDQTCNDLASMSALAGACQSDGTCVCRTGYVLNPRTGLCYYVDVAPDASVGTDIGAGKDGAGKDAGKVLADAPVGKDTGQDVADVPVTGDTSGACTPGMDQTCNDSPVASYISGTCQSNGTCICKSGYVINPSTARCMVPAAGTCAGTYEACGCGCCGSGAPSPVCYYPSAGDSLSAIIAADQAAKSSPTCALAGCALGQWYLCCMEAAAEPASSAQYSATYTSGAYDRIGLTKTESGGNCVRLNLVNPGSGGSGRRPLRVTTPDNWAIEGSIFAGACSSSSPAQAIGAQGSVSFNPSGTSACTISAHMTLFFAATADTPVTTMRIDADNVLISGGGPAGYCQ